MTRGGGWWVARGGCASAAAIAVLGATPALGWGGDGHALVVRAALASRAELPSWFRDAGIRLAALANAPDRWRALDDTVPELAARAPDHFFDLDVWGREVLPRDRWAYVHRAAARRMAPEKIGFLPYAALEEYGVLVSAFRDARAGLDGAREEALVAAGVVAHLVGDAAVPLHATKHHHGWVGRNPEGFTRRSGVHQWFETTVVRDVGKDVRVGNEAGNRLSDVRVAVEELLANSLAAVPDLYRAERDQAQRPDAVRDLVRARLIAGATLLARVWQAAWRASGS
jgi:hypothetical protein